MKKAFTMTELILVIVVLGVMSGAILPKLEKKYKSELSDNVISDIRYAQHLATTDFKQSNSDLEWQRTFWNVSFKTCTDGGVFTTINTDISKDGVLDLYESTFDVISNKYMYANKLGTCKTITNSNTSPRILLTKQFAVSRVAFTGGCLNTDSIGFDRYGRPHVGFQDSDAPDFSSIMKTECIITFALASGESLSIGIAPETGFVRKI